LNSKSKKRALLWFRFFKGLISLENLDSSKGKNIKEYLKALVFLQEIFFKQGVLTSGTWQFFNTYW